MTGIIILAAGASTRMGQAKQQLLYKQQTLLQRAMQVAAGVADSKVLVVLGANNQAILTGVDSTIADIVINPDWEQGMASSIKAGITALLQLYPNADSALLMLCDQPFVNTELLNQLVQFKTDEAIIASAYQNTIGAPVLFGKNRFPQLQQLQGQEGAKKLLMQYPDEVTTVPFEKGAVDIDTPADYQKLLNNK